MVSVPAPIGTERGDERILALEDVQRALAMALTGQRIGQIAADAGYQAGAQQELPGLG